jgi:hypothetical protein
MLTYADTFAAAEEDQDTKPLNRVPLMYYESMHVEVA